MSGGWDDAEQRVPWRERRPEGWDGTGRMSLNEWWDDLVAPRRSILLARLVIVAVGVLLVVVNGWPGVPFLVLLWGIAASVRLRTQAPRAGPAEPRPPWRPPVAWSHEPGDHAVELVVNGASGGRVNSACLRAVGHLLDSRKLREIDAVYGHAPCVVRRDLSRESAETAVRLLEASGARARVLPPDRSA